MSSPALYHEGKEKARKERGGERERRKLKGVERGMKVSRVALMMSDYLTFINYLIYDNYVFFRRK